MIHTTRRQILFDTIRAAQLDRIRPDATIFPTQTWETFIYAFGRP